MVEMWSDGEVTKPKIWFIKRDLERAYIAIGILIAYSVMVTITLGVVAGGACK